MLDERTIEVAVKALEELRLSPGRLDRHALRIIAMTVLNAAAKEEARC